MKFYCQIRSKVKKLSFTVEKRFPLIQAKHNLLLFINMHGFKPSF